VACGNEATEGSSLKRVLKVRDALASHDEDFGSCAHPDPSTVQRDPYSTVIGIRISKTESMAIPPFSAGENFHCLSVLTTI